MSSLWYLILLVSACLVSAEPPAGETAFYAEFRSANSLSGWSVPSGASLVDEGYKAGDMALQVTSKDSGTHLVSKSVDLSKYKGCTLRVSPLIKAVSVSKPGESYNGIKTMVTIKTNKTVTYANAMNVYGTFNWNSTVDEELIDIRDDYVSSQVSLGLQDCNGVVLFDHINISVQACNVPYNPFKGHDGIPTLRGTMSPIMYTPSIPDDLMVLGAEWKANLIRWQVGSPEVDWTNMEAYDQWAQERGTEIEKVLDLCVKYGILAVIDNHRPPGGDSDKGYLIHYNVTYQQKLVETWKIWAAKFKGHKGVWGYDIMNEPHMNQPVPAGVPTWPQLAQTIVNAIRAIDSLVPIIIEPFQWASVNNLATLGTFEGGRIIYSIHMYEPGTFTQQGVGKIPVGAVYPGTINGKYWNITTIQEWLQPGRDFALRHNVQIYVGEFSAIRWAKGAAQYIQDVMTVCESFGWDYSYHAFREWQGWSVEYDENINDLKPVTYNTTRKLELLSRFSKNVKPPIPF